MKLVFLDILYSFQPVLAPPVVLGDVQDTLGVLWKPRQVNASDD